MLVRRLLRWAWDTTRDVYWEVRHVWKVYGEITPRLDWRPFPSDEGPCFRTVFGRLELFARQEVVSGGAWYMQIQDLMTHEPLYVSELSFGSVAEAQRAAIDFVLNGGLRGGDKGVAVLGTHEQALSPPRFGHGGGSQ